MIFETAQHKLIIRIKKQSFVPEGANLLNYEQLPQIAFCIKQFCLYLFNKKNKLLPLF